MKLTVLTHNDLDGYGCSTVIADRFAVERIVHVTRYADVVPVFAAEMERLRRTEEPGMLALTDLAVEPGLADLLHAYAGMNASRAKPHHLVLLDHHASSVDVLDAAGIPRSGELGAGVLFDPAGQAASLGAATPVLALVDTTRCATRLCREHEHLLRWRTGRGPGGMDDAALDALVRAVDAVDLWDRGRPEFDAGAAVNDLFWEAVLTYVPPGHDSHDAFVSGILREAAVRLSHGVEAEHVEAAGYEIRRYAVEALVAKAGLEETPKQAAMSTRMRLSRLLARSPGLFVEPVPGLPVRLCHAVDPGIFQRVSDFMLDEGDAEVVVNVMRGGAMSFRSRDGQALEMAVRFGGGGHANSAGARLPTDAVFSLDEAERLVRDVIGDEGPAPGR